MWEGVCRASNIASVELSVLGEVDKCWVTSEKNNTLLELIRKEVVAHSFVVPTVLSSMVVNQEQAPAPL